MEVAPAVHGSFFEFMSCFRFVTDLFFVSLKSLPRRQPGRWGVRLFVCVRS